MTKRILGGVLAVALLWAAPAAAQPFGAAEEAAYMAAVEWWGEAPPLCGEVVKEVGGLEGVENGRATMPTRYNPVCYLTIRSGLRPPELCVAMHHEVGHLLGFDDSVDPGWVMYWEASPYTVPECAELEDALVAEREVEEAQVRARQDAETRWWWWRMIRAECLHMKKPKRQHCWQRVRIAAARAEGNA